MISELLHILQIEDNPGDAFLVEEMLNESCIEFKLKCAERLSAGIELSKSGSFDVILLDLGLPDSKGLDSIRKLSQIENKAPVIVLTGLSDETTGLQAVKEGAQDYLVKGQIDKNLLVRTIQYAIERKKAEEKIQSLLKEKELLLKEVHHRIKNNMAIVSGMLMMQAYSMKDKSAISALNDAQSRIHTMSSLYDKLYRSDNFSDISLKDYLGKLIDEIFLSLPDSSRISVEKHIDDFIISGRISFSLGIIINEILTNIMKYAFKGRDKGTVIISASNNDHMAMIVLQDDGVGIPENVNIMESTGFGMKLLGMMTEQIKGNINIERGNGTKFILEFPV